MVAWRNILLCDYAPKTRAEREVSSTISDLKASRHPGCASVSDYVAKRYRDVVQQHPAAANVFSTRLQDYAAHIKNKAGHRGRYSELHDEMRSIKAAEVRTGLNFLGLQPEPADLAECLAIEARVLGSEKHGKYAHVQEVPIAATYDPASLLLHASGQASTDAICRQIIDAQREVIMQSFIYAQGCSQAQDIAAALVQKHKALAAAPPAQPLRVVLAVSWPRGALAPRIMKPSESWGFLGTGAFTDRDGALDESPNARGISLEALCAQFDPKIIDFSVVGLRHVGRSLHHKKQYVFDAERAHIPTHNIAGPHTSSPGPDGKIMPGVRDVAVSFSGGNAPLAVRNDIMRSCRRWGTVLLSSRWPKVSSRHNHAMLSHDFSALPLPKADAAKQATLILAEQDIAPLWLDIASAGHLSPAYAMIKCLLANAKQSLCIMTPNLQIFDVLAHLQEAMARGVVVRILLTEHENADAAQLAGLTNEQSVALLKQFAATHGLAENLEVRWNRETVPGSAEILEPYGWGPGSIHAKLYIADGRFVATGSYNLDYQSFKSSENIVVVEQPSEENAFMRFFLEQHNRGAQQRRYPDDAPTLSVMMRAAATLTQARPSYGRYDIRDLDAEGFTHSRRAIIQALKHEGTAAVRQKLRATVNKLHLHRPQNRPWLDSLIEHVKKLHVSGAEKSKRDALLVELQELRNQPLTPVASAAAAA